MWRVPHIAKEGGDVALYRTMIDDVVSEVGNLTETDGLVKNEAAKTIEHLIGHKAALMFGEQLEDLKNNPQQYSVVFKDRGLRVRALSAISEKARTTDFPLDADTVRVEFENFMNYCFTFAISPTLGLFATWLGVSLEDFEGKLAHYKSTRPETARAFEVCKELLRGFLETKALDGDIAPAIYLHQNKAYFDAVESAPVKKKKETEAHVRDESQLAELIELLPVDVVSGGTAD